MSPLRQEKPLVDEAIDQERPSSLTRGFRCFSTVLRCRCPARPLTSRPGSSGGTEPDWLFAVRVKRVDCSGEAERRDADLLSMPGTNLVGTDESRGRLRMVAYPETSAGHYGLPTGGERLVLIAEQPNEKFTVHTSNLPSCPRDVRSGSAWLRLHGPSNG